MIRLGLCCMFRDQSIKFVITTANAKELVVMGLAGELQAERDRRGGRKKS